MPYGSLLADVVKSSTSSPITFQNTSGTEIGTLCRAWVNFNGTGTVAIRASFNVSSITDNGTGDYTINFTTAMPDANYGVSSFSGRLFGTGVGDPAIIQGYNSTSYGNMVSTTFLRVKNINQSGSVYDPEVIGISIFR